MTTHRITPEENAAKSKEQRVLYREVRYVYQWPDVWTNHDENLWKMVVGEYLEPYDKWHRACLQLGYATRQIYEPVTAVEAVEEVATAAVNLRMAIVEKNNPDFTHSELVTIQTQYADGISCGFGIMDNQVQTLQTQLQAANAEIAALKEKVRRAEATLEKVRNTCMGESLLQDSYRLELTVDRINNYYKFKNK